LLIGCASGLDRVRRPGPHRPGRIVALGDATEFQADRGFIGATGLRVVAPGLVDLARRPPAQARP
jgi:predicted amidohydrolase